MGFDAGKKVKGIKRHLIVDTEGLILAVMVLPANIQDRDATPELLGHARRLFPWLQLVFADGGYAGLKLAAALPGTEPIAIEIVRRPSDQCGFAVLPRCWVVERTFSWLYRNRRLDKHYEALAAIAIGFIKLAMIVLMLRRLTAHCQTL